jgi:hypothetical protein
MKPLESRRVEVRALPVPGERSEELVLGVVVRREGDPDARDPHASTRARLRVFIVALLRSAPFLRLTGLTIGGARRSGHRFVRRDRSQGSTPDRDATNRDATLGGAH